MFFMKGNIIYARRPARLSRCPAPDLNHTRKMTKRDDPYLQ